MIRSALVSMVYAMAMTVAQAQQIQCMPASPLSITGTSNAVGKWAGWMCDGKPEIVACTTDHCTDAVINAGWWVWDRGLNLSDANAALKKYGAVSKCDPLIRAVWWPDRYKLREKLGMSDTDIAAICPQNR